MTRGPASDDDAFIDFSGIVVSICDPASLDRAGGADGPVGTLHYIETLNLRDKVLLRRIFPYQIWTSANEARNYPRRNLFLVATTEDN
jgi:hypothetical protein